MSQRRNLRNIWRIQLRLTELTLGRTCIAPYWIIQGDLPWQITLLSKKEEDCIHLMKKPWIDSELREPRSFGKKALHKCKSENFEIQEWLIQKLAEKLGESSIWNNLIKCSEIWILFHLMFTSKIVYYFLFCDLVRLWK